MGYSNTAHTYCASLAPFVHVVAKSLSEDAYVIANKVFLWPAGFTLDAYGKVFADQSILRSLYISVIITVLFTDRHDRHHLCDLPAIRKRLKAVRFNFIFMFTMFFGGGIIPEYMLINSLGMLDTMWSLILPLSFAHLTC